MPARRELHTGRYNFLHRSWGPIEPFDDSMPEILKNNGIYSHLISDHGHYWEDGGSTYHNRYNSWEILRGQEHDPWKGQIKEPDFPEHIGQQQRQNLINRKYITEEHEFPQARTFSLGMDFIDKNADEDNWFLQIETFDPHEPYHAPQKYKDLYPHNYAGPKFDWPKYARVQETPEQVQHCRYEYAALLSMCDAYLGMVMDQMDELDLWKDTMLIVNTDHGFLLGEHGWWAKNIQPQYNEIVHIPLFIWDPRLNKKAEYRQSLVQTIDLAPTVLDFFGLTIPEDVQGKPLKAVIENDTPVRETALFGRHGGHINITDGEYVYMRAPEDLPIYNYTLMPTHLNWLFTPEELQGVELDGPFSFTKGCKVLKVRSTGGTPGKQYPQQVPIETMLFNVKEDPSQENPLQNERVEARLIEALVNQLKTNDAPEELYARMGLPQ